MYVFCKCLSIVIFLALLFSGKLLSLCNEKIQNSILGKQSSTAVLRAVLCFADISLIIYIGFQKTVDAFILLATMLVFTAIWSILCVVGIVDERKVSAPKLDSKILKNAKKSTDKWGWNPFSNLLLHDSQWYEECRVWWVACISGIHSRTGNFGVSQLLSFAIYFCSKGIAVAKLSQKNHKLSFGPDYYGIFDNVISV